MVRNSPATAGHVGLIPDLGRSHMPLSNKAHELQLLSQVSLEPLLRNKTSHHSKKRTHHNSRVTPQATTTEKPAQQ